MRAAVVLWWVQCALALACTLLLPFYMFTHHRCGGWAGGQVGWWRDGSAGGDVQAVSWLPVAPASSPVSALPQRASLFACQPLSLPTRVKP